MTPDFYGFPIHFGVAWCDTPGAVARVRLSPAGAALIAIGLILGLQPDAVAAPSGTSAQSSSEVDRLVANAQSASASGNLNLALIELKNAVQLAPSNGDVRAQLGVTLLAVGQNEAAERELRQARADYGPSNVVTPALLRVMLRRNEAKQLLAEFPDPQLGSEDETTVDILNARAAALQILGQARDARSAMDRSLALRRDPANLVQSAGLAVQQSDLSLASRQTEEAIRLSPNYEEAWIFRVMLADETGGARQALAAAEQFVQQLPKSTAAKTMRIQALLELGADTRVRAEANALAKDAPTSPYVPYFRGVLLARSKDFNGAWAQMQNLPAAFVQSESRIAMTIASIAAANGKTETAGAILTTLIVTQPELRDARLQLAALRLGQSAPEDAIKVLSPPEFSNDSDVHALLAQAYLMERRFDQAIASFEIANRSSAVVAQQKAKTGGAEVGAADLQAMKANRENLQRDPRNVALAAVLISELARSSKWDEAIAITNELARQAPESPLPPLYGGQVLVARGDVDGAVAQFSKALALDPNFVPARYYRANALMARGDDEQAQKDLRLITSTNPQQMMAYLKLAEIAGKNDQDQEVSTQLAKAMSFAPKDPAPRLALANYLLVRGKYQDADAAVNGLLQLSPNNPDALGLRGQIQMSSGQTATAIKTFQVLAKLKPGEPGAWVLLARAFAANGDQNSAEDTAHRATELAPESVELRKELIDIEIAAGRTQSAIATARSFASNNHSPAADLLLATTLVRLNQAKEAESVLERSLTSQPDSRVVMRLSELAWNSGNISRAKSLLAAWVSNNPTDFEVRRAYAAVLTQSGNPALGRKEYEAILEQSPDDPVVLNNLGVMVETENPDRALSMVSRAAKIAPRSPEIADTLGWIKYQRRDPKAALPLLQRAHELDANNGPISFHLAVVLHALGRASEAKTLLRQTLTKNSSFDGADEARQALARW